MGRQNIFSVFGVSNILPQSMCQDLSTSLMKSHPYFLHADKVTDAFRSRYAGSSFTSDIVNRIAAVGGDKMFTLMKLPPKSTSLREVIDMTFVPFDILQLKDKIPSHSKALSVIRELDDKIVINVTDISRADGTIADITQFQWRVLRDFLSRSYYVSSRNIWLSTDVVRYVAKVYSMTIGGQIGHLFQLSPQACQFIQSIFALFYVGLMTNEHDAPVFMRGNAQKLGIVDRQALEQVLMFTQDTLHKPTPSSLEDVFTVINGFGFDQLQQGGKPRLNRAVLNSKFAYVYNESHVSTIALEYPPYFLGLIIRILSGERLGSLAFSMKNLHLLADGKTTIGDLVRSPSLTDM